MQYLFRVFAVVTMLFVSESMVAQQTSKLNGKVTDSQTGEELVGASVSVVGQKLGKTTNIDGEFTITIATGTYDLQISYLGYKTKTVRNVLVKEPATRQDIQLAPESVQAQEIVVEAEVSSATEGALLTQQKKSLVAQDAISAEQIKKTPDSDAAEAAKRITGVTVVGNKYVFVRGLGERYSSTQLNGMNIPSPEPEKKVVPFDIIPASLVENIITIKTFMPDQPGNFAGGLVKIKTKEFPDQLQLNFGQGSGFNSRSHFKNLLTYAGGGRDFLAIDDGFRKLPSSLPDAATLQTKPGVGLEAGNYVSQFNNGVWSPKSGSYAINQSYNISVGNQVNLLGIPLGFIGSFTYSSDVNYKETKLFGPNFADTSNISYRFNSNAATYNVNWGGLAHLNLRLGQDNKLGLKTTYNRAGEDETREAIGEERDTRGSLTRSTRLRFVSRELWSTQLIGNHFFSQIFKSEFDWALQYATAKRDEPDNRETQFVGDGVTFNPNSNGRNQRFFSYQEDKQWDGLFNWVIPFNQWEGLKSKIKLGTYYYTKDREFSARRFSFRGNFGRAFDQTLTGNISGISIDSVFLPKYISQEITVQGVSGYPIRFADETLPSDQYTATETNKAFYIMMELPITGNIRLIGGARLEQNILDVNSKGGTTFTDATAIKGGFDNTNLLPSINLIYSPKEQINFRFSYTQTIAQPEMREVAPFRFDDFVSQNYGNPFLTQTKIRNYDFRAELYPNFGELFAVSVFYKQLDQPLEKIIDFTSAVARINVVNAEKASLFGTEIEFRKRLGFINKSLEDLSVGLNLTLVSSEITIKDQITIYNESEPDGKLILPTADFQKAKRPLQGQSPYVVNLNFSYDNRQLGLNTTVLYNIAGRRISAVASDIAVPFNVYEEERNQIDISISKSLFTNFTAKLNIKNLLDDRYLFTVNETTEIERYQIGRIISLSLSYGL